MPSVTSRELIERLVEAVPPGLARDRLEHQRYALVAGPGDGFLVKLVNDVGDVATVLASVGFSAAMLLHLMPDQEPWWRLTVRVTTWLLTPPLLVGLAAATSKAVALGVSTLVQRGRRLLRRRAERLFIYAVDLRWDRVLALLERGRADDNLRAYVPRLLAIALAYLPHLTAAAAPPALLDEHLAVVERWSTEVGLRALPDLSAAADAVEHTSAAAEQKGRVLAALLRIGEQVDGSRGPMR
jgi:hypothetical protein